VYLDHVTADSRSPATPIAIRITRPYATEDEYLEHDLDTLTRASITLVGAQPRAEGMVLRFEVVLPSGYVLIRGEGRVVGFKANAHQGAGGLSLRFTKLDVRSKALVDKAAALRDRKRPSLRPPSASDPPPAPTGPRMSVPPPLRAAPSPSRPPGTRTPPPLPVTAPGAPRLSNAPPPPLPRSAALSAPEAFVPVPPPIEAPVLPRTPTPMPPRMPSPLPPRMPSPVPPAALSPAPVDLQPAMPLAETVSLAAAPQETLSLAAAPRPSVDRDNLLGRLRERARRLDPAFLANILDRSRWS
jgi:hypothetical protein